MTRLRAFGGRLVAWIILAFLAVVLLKIVIGAVAGFVKFVLLIVLLAGMAALAAWALRRA